MKIFLVRHTESKAQTEEEYSLDANLSDFGIQQAKELQNPLTKISFDQIFLSPLKRARQTFEHSEVKCPKVSFDTRLIEELPKGMYSENILPYERTPSYACLDTHNAWEEPVQARALSFISELKDLKKINNIMVVAHAGILNHIFHCFLNFGANVKPNKNQVKATMANGAISILEINCDKQSTIIKWNDTSHLSK